MDARARPRQIREIFDWMKEEALVTLSPDRVCFTLPEYLPPVLAEQGAREFIRRAGRTLRRAIQSDDRVMATAFYEDHVDPAACCVTLLMHLERSGKGELSVDHTWLDEVGNAAERLLSHSVEMKMRAETDALAVEVRLPVFQESTVAKQRRDTILLVEDDRFVRSVTREVLEEGGRRVLEAQDAEQALRVFGRNRRAIGLVISDVAMPGRSGVELARWLRKSAPRLPVLLTSGYSTAMGENAARRTFFLEKPYDAGALLRAVNQCLCVDPIVRG